MSSIVTTDGHRPMVTISALGEMGFSSTGRITFTKITANSVTVTAGGTDASSIVANLQTENDGNIFHLDEAAATPGIDMYVEFINVDSFNLIKIRASYVGSATHALSIGLYDWVAGEWKAKQCIQNMIYNIDTTKKEIICSESFIEASCANFIGTGGNDGKVRVGIYHPMAGSASHDLYIDLVALYQ